MTKQPVNHDIIAIGASAGGVEALQTLVSGLPADLTAAVFIVLHIGRSRSELAQILDRAGPLPAMPAKSGERIETGRIYVAVPDRHLLIHDSHVLLRRGPHENLSRPAVDPLFRSAACSFGVRVIGVVLSGALNDGTAGLRAVKRCGGLAVVQDPADAVMRDMPESALRYVAVDHCVPASAMGPLLARLAATPVGRTPEIPADIRFEAAIAAQELKDMTAKEQQIGKPSPFSCPECGGTLWELADGNMLRYRCHVGHAYTAEAMLAAGTDEIDKLLSRLLRSHRDRAEVVRRMAALERELHHDKEADRLLVRAREYEENAELMQRLIAHRNGGPPAAGGG
ncbi:MAG TPA: chemotaxis protein CheB [Stellaceae bacterium]|nr:chemotaxis protein CheB [Stellaceae bacterium]